ncbi:MAG: GNAT family N-acetyltransferase [Acidimicrobiales bacterium]
MDATVRNAEARSRYELVHDGQVVAIADYADHGEVVVLPHTEVARHLRGQGYGAQVVQGALDDLRARGKRIVPACWYVREFIDDNAEYAELVA